MEITTVSLDLAKNAVRVHTIGARARSSSSER